MLQDVSLRWVELKPNGPDQPVGTDSPWADATEGRDCSAHFSPDGSQVIFTSFRSGEGNFWFAGRNGSGLRLMAPTVGEGEGRALQIQEGSTGGWSPDGRRLILDLTIDGNSDIYITDSRGTQPRRITSEPSMDTTPAWSPDGRSVYFTSDRSGSPQIWRISAEGGSATQITFHGGFFPQPSRDGQHVYYNAYLAGSDSPNVLKRVPAGGGHESVVVEGLSSFSWSVLPDGVYFAVRERGKDYLDRYDPATTRRTRLGVLPFQIARGFCGFMRMSPDGRALLANRVDRFETNLGLLEMSH
jgi:TolB protein